MLISTVLFSAAFLVAIQFAIKRPWIRALAVVASFAVATLISLKVGYAIGQVSARNSTTEEIRTKLTILQDAAAKGDLSQVRTGLSVALHQLPVPEGHIDLQEVLSTGIPPGALDCGVAWSREPLK
jgi:hypothetical protein